MSKDPSLADLAQLRLRHPDYFKANSLYNHFDFWEDLILSTGYTCPQVNLLQTIREGVRVDSFLRHFKSNFKGKRYDSAAPPISFFPKSPCCHQLRRLDPVILWGYHPTLKLSGILTFNLIVSLTYSMDNI